MSFQYLRKKLPTGFIALKSIHKYENKIVES